SMPSKTFNAALQTKLPRRTVRKMDRLLAKRCDLHQELFSLYPLFGLGHANISETVDRVRTELFNGRRGCLELGLRFASVTRTHRAKRTTSICNSISPTVTDRFSNRTRRSAIITC